MVCPRRFIITLVAFVWFFSTVYFQMCLQIPCLRECIELKVVMDICHGENSLYDDRTAHKCDQADYTSYQASNLRRHLKTHSGEKSNKCNQCDSVFSCSVFLVGPFKQTFSTRLTEKGGKLSGKILWKQILLLQHNIKHCEFWRLDPDVTAPWQGKIIWHWQLLKVGTDLSVLTEILSC